MTQWSDEQARKFRAVTEERDQLRARVRELEETLGEALESLAFANAERARLVDAYRAFR